MIEGLEELLGCDAGGLMGLELNVQPSYKDGFGRNNRMTMNYNFRVYTHKHLESKQVLINYDRSP